MYHIVEVALQIEGSILGDEADASSLTQCKAFGHFLHSEALVFATPVIALYLQSVLLAYEIVLGRFIPNTSRAYLVYLFREFFYLLLPRLDANKNLFVIRELGRQLGFLDKAVVMAVTQGHILLGAVTSHAARYGVLNVKGSACTDEISDADILTCVKAHVVLFLPQLELEYVGLCRLDIAVGLLPVQLLQLLCIFLVLLVQCPLMFVYSGTHIGIVQ